MKSQNETPSLHDLASPVYELLKHFETKLDELLKLPETAFENSLQEYPEMRWKLCNRRSMTGLRLKRSAKSALEKQAGTQTELLKMKKKDRFLQGWRACEHHFQTKLRQDINKKINEIVLGYHMSFSDDVALKYYKDKEDDSDDGKDKV